MRVKYDIYESLPNLDRVEEIDGVVVHKYNERLRNTYIDEDRISNVNSFEADPDLSHCLIYQKMQVSFMLFVLVFAPRRSFLIDPK